MLATVTYPDFIEVELDPASATNVTHAAHGCTLL
jgi:hypothetical protein